MVEPSLAELFSNGIHGMRIHMVGAGGHGSAAALELAHAAGAHATGCDRTETSLTRMLDSRGIPIILGHDPAHVADADLVIVSPAVTYLHPDMPELVAARERGIPVVKWQALLGELMRGHIGVSVAGVHGKGTTTAMLSALLIAAGLDPTCEVGETVVDWASNVHPGKGRHFINEADEWDYNFLYYHPRVVVLNAVEYDHPEFFPNYEAIRDAFVQFLRGMDFEPHPGFPPPTLVLNADNPGCLDTLAQLDSWPGQVRTFSIEGRLADVSAQEISLTSLSEFTLFVNGETIGRASLPISGAYNIANALAAVTAADTLGVPHDVIIPTLASFKGLRRRFEVSEGADGVTWINDYAHHPHAVALTIEAARQRFPDRRLIAVFQPTLYTRLQRFLTPFAEALATADEIVVVEIQPSREKDTGIIHGSALVEAIAERGSTGNVRYGGNYAETKALLREIRRPGDVIAVMGSGPVDTVIDM